MVQALSRSFNLSSYQAVRFFFSVFRCKTVVLRVAMSCEGCVGAVKRVLGKMEGLAFHHHNYSC